MDFHYERFVRARITKAQKTKVLLSFLIVLIAAPILAILATFYINIPFLGIGTICLIAWLEYMFITRMKIEYEYQLTSVNHSVDLDIAKILNEKKRKEIFSGNCKEFELVARVKGPKDSDAYRKIANRLECARSMEEEDLFFIVTNTDAGRTVIYMQLNEEMREGLKKTIPSRFFE